MYTKITYYTSHGIKSVFDIIDDDTDIKTIANELHEDSYQDLMMYHVEVSEISEEEYLQKHRYYINQFMSKITNEKFELIMDNVYINDVEYLIIRSIDSGKCYAISWEELLNNYE